MHFHLTFSHRIRTAPPALYLYLCCMERWEARGESKKKKLRYSRWEIFLYSYVYNNIHSTVYVYITYDIQHTA